MRHHHTRTNVAIWEILTGESEVWRILIGSCLLISKQMRLEDEEKQASVNWGLATMQP